MATSNITYGFNDPLYLHPSDSPGAPIVCDPLTGAENYGVWSRAMLLALRFIGYTHIVCRATARAYVEHEQTQCLIQVLMGLNDSYGSIRSQILMMSQLPSVSQAFAIVSQEEAHRTALNNQSMMEVPTAVFYSSSVKKSDHPRCENCNIVGHTKETCYKLVGYPPGHKLHRKFPQGKSSKNQMKNHQQLSAHNTSQEYTQAPASAPSFTPAQYEQIIKLLELAPSSDKPAANFAGASQGPVSTPEHSIPWILDSGANAHITGTSKNLQNIQPCDSANGSVRLPNGNLTHILSTGSLTIPSFCTLHNVLHVPDFKFNLLSISKFTKDHHCSVVFYPDFCFFQDLSTGKIMGIGKLYNGLYYLAETPQNIQTDRILSSPKLTCTSFACKDIDINIWHQRFGHMSISRLQHLPFITQNTLNSPCYICPISKQTRSMFPAKDHTPAPRPFSLIHMDTWGPYRTPTHNGARYFLTIVDDFSRCTWVFLMHLKSDVLTVIKNFLTFVTTQFNTKVQTIRTDNALDFLNSECNNLFNSLGIIHQSSCPYTPQQNGLVERKHRHILNVARAVKFQASIPDIYWGECVLHAAYIINRTPTPLLSHKTPYEALFSKPPSYQHMRVFGCLCFASNLKPSHKFDVRARACVFLGYPPHQKGYKLLDTLTNRIFISRDVVFHETTFPFSNQPSSSTTFNKFLPHPASIPEPEPTEPSSHNQLVDTVPNNISQTTTGSPSTRHSSRPRNPPYWTNDYVCSFSTTPYDIANYLSYKNLSPTYCSFLTNISQATEPRSYQEAAADPRWQEAMAAEITALEANHTWKIVPLPPGKKAVGCRWVYKIKYKSDGSIDRFKARLVAKGYTQTYGIDYQDTFSPVAKIVTVRCLLTIASARNWPLHQMDVANAFLQGDLEEDIYMAIPPGFPNQSPNMACKLLKSLYGLKQASRQWNTKLCQILTQDGYTRSHHDHSLTQLKQHLHAHLHIKDLGPLK
ncbi:hypothetical protein F511_24735 [Dorcoceras hygrometricum]|uniref:Integrase catalytic domain-containing protein n=1 Tax=Dorcoceras hygrometricum TaxID=472368 RepID=A0A2Z7AHC5_9LAMI|nr:hypothetical protein F511_24735 [Dorcoceras hygrometricum]